MANSSFDDKSATYSSQLLVEIAIAVATIPTLATFVGATVFARATQDLGRWSEELFRGDRLPLLHIPSTSTDPESR